jgi:tRNA modification GTPase
MLDDTIAAIATPLGEGGLAVIRLSGSAALEVVDRCFAPAGRSCTSLARVPSHTLHYGHVVRGAQRVDEVLVAVLRAPRTYTRQDVVEISCHGGLLPARLVLETVLAAGARLAQPGEFTQRAFLNGRLDLTQAEAVADLIHSRTDLALRAANEQLAGKLSQRMHQLRDKLMLTLAHVEAHLDFPEEDIAPDTTQQLTSRLDQAGEFMDALLRTAHEGQILRRGVRAVIVGPPNAGKSSLLNQLLGHDRAIVTPIAGTTRDTIEETANVRGLPVVLIDTAGLREAGDEIEAEGIRRSRASLERADLVLQVLDASVPLTGADLEPLSPGAGRKRILVLNKADLPARLSQAELPVSLLDNGALAVPVIPVSCATGTGLEELKDAIKESVWAGEIRAEMLEVMLNSRHQEAVRRAREAVQRASHSLRTSEGLELVAAELRLAVSAVGEIVGQTATEDLLDSIFSQFCLGK